MTGQSKCGDVETEPRSGNVRRRWWDIVDMSSAWQSGGKWWRAVRSTRPFGSGTWSRELISTLFEVMIVVLYPWYFQEGGLLARHVTKRSNYGRSYHRHCGLADRRCGHTQRSQNSILTDCWCVGGTWWVGQCRLEVRNSARCGCGIWRDSYQCRPWSSLQIMMSGGWLYRTVRCG